MALRTLDLGLDIVNGIRALDLESDGLARDCEFVSYRVLCGASQAMMAAQCVWWWLTGLDEDLHLER